MNHSGTTKNKFHLEHPPNFFSSMRSTSNKLVDHLLQAGRTHTTFGFQEMKKGILILKMVNMTLTINQESPPSDMNKRKVFALV